MSKKSEFINYVKALISGQEEPIEPSEDAQAYWEALCSGNSNGDKPTFTDNGKLVMKYLQSLPNTEMMRAKDIAEAMFVGSRTVSGAMRKLVENGFVEKMGENPVMYSLTEAGKNVNIED